MKTLNFEDLIQFRKKAQADLNVRELSYDAVSEKACGLAVGTEHIQLLCCGGTGCKASNSAKIVDNLKEVISILKQMRPATVKASYFNWVVVSSTMGIGVKVKMSDIYSI